MITKSTTTVGFQCPACGRIQTQELCAFAFSGRDEHQIACRHCKQVFAALGLNAKGQYQLSVSCVDCFSEHSFKMKRGTFWLSAIHTFDCPHSGEMILAVGKKERVMEVLEDSFYMQEEDLSEPDEAEFMTPAGNVAAIFVGAVSHLQQLAVEGKLTCACDNPQLQLKMGDGYLEVRCTHCDRSLQVDFTETDALKKIQTMESLALH